MNFSKFFFVNLFLFSVAHAGIFNEKYCKHSHNEKFVCNGLFITNEGLRTLEKCANNEKCEVRKEDLLEISQAIENLIIKTNGFKKVSYHYEALNQRPPWFSGITNARSAKFFFILSRIFKDDAFFHEKFKNLSRDLLEPIFINYKDGGFMWIEKDFLFFEEYLQPKPNHVLNAHLSIILDVFYCKEFLTNDQQELLLRATQQLPLILKIFFDDISMNVHMKMEPGESLSKKYSKILNNYDSYDLIILKYLMDLYNITNSEYLKEYFYKLLSYKLNEQDNFNTKNVLLKAEMIETTPISSVYNHSLTTAMKNFRLDPQIYASFFETKENEAFIKFIFKEAIKPLSLEIVFHWNTYPEKISIYIEKNNNFIILPLV